MRGSLREGVLIIPFDYNMKTYQSILIAFLLVLTPYVHASNLLISQNNTSGGALHFSEDGFGQSFYVNTGTIISEIELYVAVSYILGAGDATVKIFEYNPTSQTLGQLVLGTGILHKEYLSGNGSWIRVKLDSFVALSGNKTYAFLVAEGEGRYSSNQYWIGSGDAYPNGNGLTSSGHKYNFDFAFRIYNYNGDIEVDVSPHSVPASVNISVPNSDAGYTYTLYSSSDLLLPKTNWENLATKIGNGTTLNFKIESKELPRKMFFFVGIAPNE